jgi:putative transposase
MARLPRFFAPGYPLHIIQRGNNRDAIFRGTPDYVLFLDCLERAAALHGLAIHAYVLMTNHIHLLATPSDAMSAPNTMQSVGRRYVQYFNVVHRRTGTLWEGRYRATIVDAEAYLLTCMRYIELNPVRAGIVEHPSSYFWSSYRGNAEGQSDRLLSPSDVYRRLGRSAVQRQSAYRLLFSTHFEGRELDSIRVATNKAWALGDDRFQAVIEDVASRRAAPLPKGRPGVAAKTESEPNSSLNRV